MRTIIFYFDVGSPNAYLAMKPLAGVADRTRAIIEIVPVLLGGLFKLTGNQAPMLAFGGVKGKLDYERLEMERFIARHGLTKFRFNPHFPVNTLGAMRGLVAAQRAGTGDAFVEAILKAMWEDGRDLADPAVLHAVIDEAGLDGAALIAASGEPAVKAALIDNTEAAAARGVFGVPTFFVGDEMFFGKDRLAQLEEELVLR